MSVLIILAQDAGAREMLQVGGANWQRGEGWELLVGGLGDEIRTS